MKIFGWRKKSIFMPALAGGITGASLALLFAPKPGKALRKDLSRLARNTQEQVSDVIETGKELYGNGKAAVIHTVESGRKTFVEGKKKFNELTGNSRRSYVVPFLATGVIGAGIAWLFTTQSGKELRGDMKMVAGDAVDYVSSAVDKGKNLYHDGKVAVTEAVESGKKAFFEGTEKLRHVA